MYLYQIVSCSDDKHYVALSHEQCFSDKEFFNCIRECFLKDGTFYNLGGYITKQDTLHGAGFLFMIRQELIDKFGFREHQCCHHCSTFTASFYLNIYDDICGNICEQLGFNKKDILGSL